MIIEDFKRAAEAYNANPQDYDAQQALRAACGTKRVLWVKPSGKIDIDESADLLAFADKTSTPGIPDAKTVAEILAKSEPAIEADPKTWRPLHKGKTIDQPVVDWSGVPMELREVVAYGEERGELYGVTSEQAAHLLSKKTMPAQPPWLRIAGEWRVLKANPNRTRDQEDFYRRVMERLYFQAPNASTRTGGMGDAYREETISTDAPSLRKAIMRKFRTDSDFEAFCLDNFTTVKHRFGNGQDFQAKVNLLLQLVDGSAIAAALRNY